MMLEEANKRLRTCQISEEQLWDLNSLYLLLDLNKDDFCKIVDAVGLEKLIARKQYYNWVCDARDEVRQKERYVHTKEKLKQRMAHLSALEREISDMQDFIAKYEQESVVK